MNTQHGGNIRKLAEEAGLSEADILDFSANINPIGPPPWFRACISRAANTVTQYPDPEYLGLRLAIADHHDITPEEVIAGNGTSEIIYAIPRIINRNVTVVVPGYIDYARAAGQAGRKVSEFRLREEDGFRCDLGRLDDTIDGNEAIFLGQPNNPTGLLCNPGELRAFAEEHPDNLLVVDEAFIDFVKNATSLVQRRPENVIVLRSMTKFYAVPGMRLGYAVASEEVAERLRNAIPPWSLNCFAERFGREALCDKDFAHQTRRFVAKQRRELKHELENIERLRCYPGEANFLLIKINDGGLSATTLQKKLLTQGIAIRPCNNFAGLDDRFFRIAVRDEEENACLVSQLRAIIKKAPVLKKTHVKTPALMLQGTSSNAGKSVLATAFCRILLQDGYRVAPFKAQNMSLNSFVTRTGGEMGRAQVLQAQACRIEPDVMMNPVLLKPTTDVGAQVVVRGQPVGNLNAANYTDYKSELLPIVEECYEKLASEYEVIVLEGAGSPAEVNLKHHDIVNMRMARKAEAQVLLAGDIDRGGVFASFVGTMELLEKWERELIAGFLVNRFRGDQSLLRPALEYTHRHTGRPVLGVVPHINRLGLPEEDSVEFKNRRSEPQSDSDRPLDIAVIDLPHISNFTDFDPFRIEPDVSLKTARKPDELDGVDAVMIPGSKNVIGDLQFLRENGFSHTLKRLVESGEAMVVGICAGLQILGEEIADPHQIESRDGTIKGLGTLQLKTVLAEQKTLKQVAATHMTSGQKVQGYEIHHGRTEVCGDEIKAIIETEGGRQIGFSHSRKRIWGTYMHGIFDVDVFRRWFLDRLREERGLHPLGKVTAYDLEPELDRLAEIVRASVDLARIYKLMGLK
jgi:cobyric acid synthase CobQ/L-threonine-O-3-phosphate decarboxylase